MLGLDKPIYEQYWIYMRDLVLHFDFGYSYECNAPVCELIFDRLPATISLVAGAAVLWLLIGIPTGIISAIRQRSFLDRATMITTLASDLGAGLLARAGRRSTCSPRTSGSFRSSRARAATSPISTTVIRSTGPSALILPWIVLAAASAAIYARYMRSSLIDVMGEDYIRTARAKGLGERDVVMHHGVRSAITPIVTLLGLDIGILLAGNAILTESVFNIPGVGRLVFTSIERSDLPVIQGVVLFGAFFIITFNLIVDIAYAYLDPRVRY